MSLDAVRTLHASTVYPSGAVVCAEDGFDWPCRTAQALDADVAAAPPGDEEAEYAADAVFPLHVGRHTPWERNHAREVWNAFRAQARRTLREGAVTGGDDSGHDYTTEDARNAHERRTARAPGAGAAAPPGDEDAALADLRTFLGPRIVGSSAWRDARARLLARHDAGWRLVPPAPLAGDEDEAAVERVAQCLAGTAAWRKADEEERYHLRGRALTILAAARGPRTPDPGASA